MLIMICVPKKVVLLLTISLLSIFNQFKETYSSGLSLVTFIESINLSRNENNHVINITKKEDRCFRFFPTYFSELGETELIGNQKKEILNLIKYNFLSWVNYSSNIQILNSEDHVLTSIEKSQLVEKLKESDLQSLILTENYVMYNILFNDLNYNGVFNILNVCDDAKFYKGISSIEPNHALKKHPIESLLNGARNDKTLFENERKKEFKFEDNDSLEKIIKDYSNSRNLFIYNNDYSVEKVKTSGNFTDDVSNLINDIFGLETAFKLREAKDRKNLQIRDTQDEKVGKEIEESHEDISKNDQEKNIEKRNVIEDEKKELKDKKENPKNSRLLRKRTNLRKEKKCKKLYKSINNCRFYIDNRPLISNEVYHVK